MEVYALFDDISLEKINFEFLEPYSKSDRVEISYLDCVADNIRNSCDKGIKEAYVLLSKLYNNKIPEKISIWFRGFDKGVYGNSTDLAFAASLIMALNNEYELSICRKSKTIFATGVINKSGGIEAITGFKNKALSAAGNCISGTENILLFPYDNLNELNSIKASDSEFSDTIDNSGLILHPVKSMQDLLEVFELEKKRRKSHFITYAFIGAIALIFIILSSVFYKLIFPELKDKNMNSKTILSANSDKVVNSTIPVSTDGNVNVKTTPEAAGDTFSIAYHSDKGSKGFTPVISSSSAYMEKRGSGVATPGKDMPKSAGPGNKATASNNGFKVQATNSSGKLKGTILPVAGSTVDAVNTDFKMAFSEGILKGDNFDNIYVSGGKGKILSKLLGDDKKSLILRIWVKYGSSFSIVVPEGAVKCDSGKSNELCTYSFVSKQSELSFNVSSTIPFNGQSGVSLNPELIISFDEIGLEKGSNFSRISINGNAGIDSKKIRPDGKSISLSISNLKPNSTYTVVIPECAVETGTGIANSRYSFSFST